MTIEEFKAIALEKLSELCTVTFDENSVTLTATYFELEVAATPAHDDAVAGHINMVKRTRSLPGLASYVETNWQTLSKSDIWGLHLDLLIARLYVQLRTLWGPGQTTQDDLTSCRADSVVYRFNYIFTMIVRPTYFGDNFHLEIRGNGQLLFGTRITADGDLFGAVVCAIQPFLQMLIGMRDVLGKLYVVDAASTDAPVRAF